MGSGYKMGWEFGKELNGKRGLVTKVLHLVREYHSPNRDRKLSARELNGWKMEAGELS